MKRYFLFLFLFMMGYTCLSAQSNDTIEVRPAFGGYSFYQSGHRLSMSELVNALEVNTDAWSMARSAQTTSVIANIMGGIGGACIGWQLGAAMAGRKANWTVAGVGAGLIVIAYPISLSANKKLKQAVGLYNATKSTTSFWHNSELRLQISDEGLGLALSF